jgi:3-hydroxyisobutyrate dehydrogenase
MNSLRVGLIGLGNMGMIMAKKLLEKKVPLTVYDLRNEAIQEMITLGAKGAQSSCEVAEKSDVIISVVRDIPQTDTVLFGQDGVWKGIHEGAIVVLSSSLSPAYCRIVYDKGKQCKTRVIDAPVSTEARSFVPGKEFALLTFMVGGDNDAVEQCLPVFEAMANNVIPQGSIGMGQACKLVNNLAYYANRIVTTECLNLGLKAGLNLEKIKKAMSLSTGNSRSLMGIGRPNFFPVSSRTLTVATTGEKSTEELGEKDKRLALELAQEVGAQMPVVDFMEQLNPDSIYDAIPKVSKH